MYEGSMVGSGAVVFALMGYIITHQEFIRGTSRWVIRLNPVLIGAILGEKPGDVSEAIEFLCKPDAESTSKEQEGRRLVPMAEGSMEYWVVNGDKYQEMRDYEDRKLQNREAQRRWREKQKGEQLVLEPGEAKPKAASEPPANGEHARLIALWTDAFKAKFGTPYLFAKGRDGKAVKELLEAGWTPEQVMEKAREAWDVKPDHGGDDHCWNCVNRSKTLHGFREASAKIVTELAAQAKRTCL